ncbi:MAG TPA: hypothetical protein VFK06_08385 [Candidatus Angelobacter sp.]|nr:hypothetical protein [Candidatus Angelobacter sp.]
MKSRCRLLVVGLILAPLIGCARYRFPLSREVMQTPNTEIWAVRAQKSESQYRTHSITRLNGAGPAAGEPTSVIALGTTANWQWEVRAVPSLLPSLKAWQSDKEVLLPSNGSDDLDHPAVSWEQAFARAYKVVNYLLGRTPPPMKLSLLLVPKGSAYKKNFVQTGNDLIPLTFAFYYPAASSETDALTSDRFSALVEAVSKVVHEYQHALVDTKAIEQTGSNRVDKTINSEIRSQCWAESTTFALASGTASYLKWNPAFPSELIEHNPDHNKQKNAQPRQRRFSDADLWAGHLLAKNLSAYLLDRGFAEPKVEYSDPAGMNAVVSFCGSITQHPRDLTVDLYSTSQVELTPLFPTTISPSKDGVKK